MSRAMARTRMDSGWIGGRILADSSFFSCKERKSALLGYGHGICDGFEIRARVAAMATTGHDRFLRGLQLGR